MGYRNRGRYEQRDWDDRWGRDSEERERAENRSRNWTLHRQEDDEPRFSRLGSNSSLDSEQEGYWRDRSPRERYREDYLGRSYSRRYAEPNVDDTYGSSGRRYEGYWDHPGRDYDRGFRGDLRRRSSNPVFTREPYQGAYDRHYDERENDRSWWNRASDEVSSWFGDEEAERRRLMDRRRNESHRGRGPKGYRRSDDRIKEDVSDRLTDNDLLDATDIDVDVKECSVVLSGSVSDRYAKRLAEDITEGVPGVRNVENRLHISSPSGEYSGVSGSMGYTEPLSKSTTTKG